VTDIPEVLFVCTHNAGRSQMAAALLRQQAAGRVRVTSAGSRPADELNPAVVRAMAEIGLDISGRVPRRLHSDQVRAADVVITMGCGDACPVYPGRRYLDWELPDPAGMELADVRPIRDEIARRVEALLTELVPERPAARPADDAEDGGASREAAAPGQDGGQPAAAAPASWAPDACTLPTAERPLRIASFDQFFAGAVRAVTRPGPDRLRLDLRPGPEVAARAAELAAAETECCSFFTFALTASGGGLTLDVSVPDGQVAVLDALTRRATDAARAGTPAGSPAPAGQAT